MESYHNTAIVLGDLKEALLYFDYVIPLNLTGQFMGLRPATNQNGAKVKKVKEPSMEGYRELREAFKDPDEVRKLYPPHLAQNPYFQIAVNSFDGFLFSYMIKTLHGEEAFRQYIGTLADVVKTDKPANPDLLCPTIDGLHRLFSYMSQTFSLQDILVDCSHLFIREANADAATETLLVNQLHVIDTDKITTPHILEFRKDKETMKKMRNFRLFIYKQYSGKDKSFVEDDIQKQMSDYRDAVKSCGFETRVKTLTYLLESKFLIGALATSAIGLLFHNQELIKDAFATGAIVEVGKLSLQYAKQRHELRKICRDNPISYLAEAKQLEN